MHPPVSVNTRQSGLSAAVKAKDCKCREMVHFLFWSRRGRSAGGNTKAGVKVIRDFG